MRCRRYGWPISEKIFAQLGSLYDVGCPDLSVISGTTRSTSVGKTGRHLRAQLRVILWLIS